MSLKKCKECGTQVSSKADKCPSCGAPLKKKTSTLTWLVLLIVIFGVVVAFQEPTPTSTPATTTATEQLDTSVDAQKKREALIHKLIKTGIISKVTTPSVLPHIYVDSGFYALSIDDKSRFINVIASYYQASNPKASPAVIFDSRSGKEIGTFTDGQMVLNN